MHRLLLAFLSLVGWTCIAISSIAPWFEVPIAASGTSQLFPPITTESSPWIVVFQCTTVCLTLATIVIWTLHPEKRQIATAIAALGLVVVMLFPHCQMVWEPALTAQASWLQIQHENLTWFGGDIFRGQELEATPAQMQVYLSDSPRHVNVMKLPTWSLQSMGLHQLPNLLQWLGYTNTFCQFVAWGWPLAVFGLASVLMTTMFDHRRICVARLRTCFRTLLICGFAGTIIAWHWPFRASLMLARAADATHRGDHATAYDQLTAAARTWPPLQQDTWFVAQTGLTANLIGVASAHARLHEARSLEDAKQFDRASAAFRTLAEVSAADGPIRREACRGILRQAIRALNSGETAKAVRGFRFVLKIEPCNIKSLYALQIAHGQDGHWSESQAAHDQLTEVYAHLNFPNKKIVLGKSQAMVDQPRMFHDEFADLHP